MGVGRYQGHIQMTLEARQCQLCVSVSHGMEVALRLQTLGVADPWGVRNHLAPCIRQDPGEPLML